MSSQLFLLIKFLIKTRYSMPALMFILALILFSNLGFARTENLPTFFSTYLIIIFTLVLSTAFFLGGLLLIKSDADYLLTLPLSRFHFVLSLFLIQFLSFGLIMLFLFAFFYLIAGIIGLMFSIAFSLISTSLSTISYNLTLKKKLILGSALITWFLSPLLGFEFSPTYIFIKHSTFALVSLLLLTGLTLYFAVKSLMKAELEIARKTVSITSSEVKKPMSFEKSKGVKAVYKFHIEGFRILSRTNFMGVSSIRLVRINVIYLFLVSSLASLLIFALIENLGNILFKLIMILSVNYVAYLFSIILSSGSLSDERIWLSFTSMDPVKYLRHVFLARALATLIIFSPLAAISFIVFLINGIPEMVGTIFLVTFFLPSFSFLISLTANYLRPVQVREEALTAYQFTLRDIAFTFFALFGFFLVILHTSPLLAIVISLVTATLSMFIISRDEILRKLCYKLAESGFI